MSEHMKRLAAPRTWPIHKKSNVFIAKQSAGSHSIENSMPAVVVIRDILKLCDTAREAKRIIGQRDVLVDGKAIRSAKAPIGLMDVVSIPGIKANYRVLLTSKGKLTLVPIEDSEKDWKLCRIENKTVVKDGKIQLNLHDGRNIVLDKNEYKTGDVLKVAFDGQKILECFPMEAGASALICEGNHAGDIETVSEYVVISGPSANVVRFEGGFETVKHNVFIVGAAAPAIKLPEVEN